MLSLRGSYHGYILIRRFIGLKSSVNHGAQFYFQLPAVQPSYIKPGITKSEHNETARNCLDLVSKLETHNQI